MMEFLNVRLHLSTRVFVHFTPVEMRPPRQGIEPAPSSLTHLTCQDITTALYTLLYMVPAAFSHTRCSWYSSVCVISPLNRAVRFIHLFIYLFRGNGDGRCRAQQRKSTRGRRVLPQTPRAVQMGVLHAG